MYLRSEGARFKHRSKNQYSLVPLMGCKHWFKSVSGDTSTFSKK